MHRPKTSTQSGTRRGVAPRPTNQAISAPVEPSSPSNDLLLQRNYQALIREHLDKALDELFAEFTRVQFHAVWTPAPPRKWDVRSLPTGCSACCRLIGSQMLPYCRACGPKHLSRALAAGENGHGFICRLGVRNYWVPIRVRGEMLGIAYLQALQKPAARILARKRARRAAHAPLRRTGARVLSRLEFARAARFLHHIVQYVQSATLSDLRKADLTSAGRAVLVLEQEQARLRLALKRHLPPASQTPRRSGSESHAQQIVHRLLERLELDYRKPITLQQCARELGMNATYLSGLFSRTTGVPFKACLTELRLEKARALLTDPAKTIAEVAFAVGYASEDRFRFAFKKATGLSPRLWRETMCMNP